MVPIKYNLRSLRARVVGSLMTILGTALVVWAAVLAFGLSAGLDHALRVSADPLDVLALRKGTTAETTSAVQEEVARRIANLPGIATNKQGDPLWAPELVVIVNTPRRQEEVPVADRQGKKTKNKANVTIRGVSGPSRELRSGFRIVAGRDFKPGVREAIAALPIALRFEGAGLGEELDIRGQKFRIVGLFECNGSSSESEVWTDNKVLTEISHRSGLVSSVQLRAASSAAQQNLIHQIESDEQIALKAVTETEYYKEQEMGGMFIKIMGQMIAFCLTIGACFAVANTMYGAVASRAREIGTLRALGFSRTSVLLSFLFESLVLCLLGAAVGCLGTLPLNGYRTGTLGASFTELTFSFRFGPWQMLYGAVLAVAMGILGGMAPAVRAVRMKVVTALREV